MYRIKKEKVKEFKAMRKDGITNRSIAEKCGLTENYISEILNGREIIKTPAFCFVKSINNELEIEDFFEII